MDGTITKDCHGFFGLNNDTIKENIIGKILCDLGNNQGYRVLRLKND